MNDAIIVKIALASESNDDLAIQRDWNRMLGAWAKANNCQVLRVEWKRLRRRFVSNPKTSNDDVYWDKVEERR